MADAKKTNPVEAIKGAVILIAAVLITYSCLGGDKSADKATVACKPDDLQCVAGERTPAAESLCKPLIEAHAKYSVRWADSMFPRIRWSNQGEGAVTFQGSAEFQNGFGAYAPVVYECDVSSDSKSVLAVRVRDGRLPPAKQ